MTGELEAVAAPAATHSRTDPNCNMSKHITLERFPKAEKKINFALLHPVQLASSDRAAAAHWLQRISSIHPAAAFPLACDLPRCPWSAPNHTTYHVRRRKRPAANITPLNATVHLCRCNRRTDRVVWDCRIVRLQLHERRQLAVPSSKLVP